MANLRFFGSKTEAEAIALTTGEQGITNALCASSDKPTLVWQGKVIGNPEGDNFDPNTLYLTPTSSQSSTTLKFTIGASSTGTKLTVGNGLTFTTNASNIPSITLKLATIDEEGTPKGDLELTGGLHIHFAEDENTNNISGLTVAPVGSIDYCVDSAGLAINAGEGLALGTDPNTSNYGKVFIKCGTGLAFANDGTLYCTGTTPIE